MSYWAKAGGRVVAAHETNRAEAPFSCPACDGELVFVAGELRTTKHFRHTVESNCAWEPETPEHEAGKIRLRDEIRRLGFGTAEVEQRVGEMVADVLWQHADRQVAFEVQAAPYEWGRFATKLQAYEKANTAVVYLFMKDRTPQASLLTFRHRTCGKRLKKVKGEA